MGVSSLLIHKKYKDWIFLDPQAPSLYTLSVKSAFLSSHLSSHPSTAADKGYMEKEKCR